MIPTKPSESELQNLPAPATPSSLKDSLRISDDEMPPSRKVHSNSYSGFLRPRQFDLAKTQGYGSTPAFTELRKITTILSDKRLDVDPANSRLVQDQPSIGSSMGYE